jgi:hypothetical protein
VLVSCRNNCCAETWAATREPLLRLARGYGGY